MAYHATFFLYLLHVIGLAMYLNLNIAGVGINLPESINSGPINPHFDTFWTESVTPDFSVEVRTIQPDESLSRQDLKPNKPFEIVYVGSGLRALRRTPEGIPLWSVETTNEMCAYSVRYNPKILHDYYFSTDDLVFKDVGLLVLVLSLHARGGLLFHGSASILGNNGIICVGRSGIGKSTISRILDKCEATVLSCERPIVRLNPSMLGGDDSSCTASVYGTPWPNVGGFALNQSAPLRRIFFLEQGCENRITPLTAKEASPRLIQFANILWDHPKLFDPCLQTVEALLSSVPTAVLSFKPDESVVDVIRRDLVAERVIG